MSAQKSSTVWEWVQSQGKPVVADIELDIKFIGVLNPDMYRKQWSKIIYKENKQQQWYYYICKYSTYL